MGCVMLEAASTSIGEKRLSCDTVSNLPSWNCSQTSVWRPQQLPFSSFVWGPVTFGFDLCTGMVPLLGAGHLILLISLVLMTLLGMLVRPRPSHRREHTWRKTMMKVPHVGVIPQQMPVQSWHFLQFIYSASRLSPLSPAGSLKCLLFCFFQRVRFRISQSIPESTEHADINKFWLSYPT